MLFPSSSITSFNLSIFLTASSDIGSSVTFLTLLTSLEFFSFSSWDGLFSNISFLVIFVIKWRNTLTLWSKSEASSLIVFPLILHLGCKNIVTIGWDFKSSNTLQQKSEYFYDSNKSIGDFNSKDDLEMIKSTNKLYDWCENNGVGVKILSKVNPCEKRFKRLESIKNI